MRGLFFIPLYKIYPLIKYSRPKSPKNRLFPQHFRLSFLTVFATMRELMPYDVTSLPEKQI